MKLSIITINYNNASGLRKTLVSVAAQTYRDIEHIIVDGGSTDGSVDIIREYAEDQTSNITNQTSHIVKWSSEPDNGIYNAMNKGIEIALGRRIVNSFNRSELVEEDYHTPYTVHRTPSQSDCDYIQILNSGDCVAAPDTIERMMGVLDQTSTLQLLLGNIVKIYPDGRKLSEKKGRANSSQPIPLDTSMLTFYGGTVPQDAAFVRRDLFEKYGLFDDKLKICADWKLYLSMIALGDVQPMYVDVDVVLFDMTGISNANIERRNAEKRAYLEEILPTSVLKDYDKYHFPMEQYDRLKRHHMWGLVRFMERVLFKFEKWHILRK